MKRRVLIIDDDASVRQAIGKVLCEAGYEVTPAADAEEAAAQFLPERFDLVVLDLNLPFRSGWDVFERVTTQHPSIPVIIVTGMPDQYRTALAAGVGALMEKPVEAPALLRTIEELLAEPEEARIRRLCGYQQDTRHFRRPGAGSTVKLSSPSKKFQQRHKLPRWSEK